jgi:hypothetical protein
MPGAERAEQLLDVRDGARAGGESGEGVTTSDEGDEQRQRERRNAPSSVGAAAGSGEGQRVLRGDVRG